jgi:AcrR family transcriptional regulator
MPIIFYYYFASKEEVLEAIILDIVEEGSRRAEKVIKEELHKVENSKLERLYLRAMLDGLYIDNEF